jgi:hypothetical protein
MTMSATNRPMCRCLERRCLLSAPISNETIDGEARAGGAKLVAYTIDVPAGAPFIVALREYGITPHLRVLSPGGKTVFDRTAKTGISAVVPTATGGTYTLQVLFDADGVDYGGYYFVTAFRAAANASEPDLTAAQSGRRYLNAIDRPGDIDVYTIDTSSGGSLLFLAKETAPSPMTPKLTLIGPDGEAKAYTAETSQHIFESPTLAGRYYAIMSDEGDNDVGTYGLSLTRVPGTQYSGEADTAPLAPGVTRRIDLPAGDADVIEIPNVKPFDKISVSLAASAGSVIHPAIRLIDPSGKERLPPSTRPRAPPARTGSSRTTPVRGAAAPAT